MENSSKEKIKEYIENSMTEKRRRHTYAVAQEASALARRYGEDPEKAELAALFHDMFRDVPDGILDGYVRACGLDPAYLGNSSLSHGKIAAWFMEREYGIKDPDLINAVAYHTTGRAGMSRLEKILYLADAIEPERNYPGVAELRKLAYENLNQACIRSMERAVEYIENRGFCLDRDTIRAKQQLSEEERREHGQP